MTWGAWVLVHDTGTTTGVIFRSSYDFPGRHGLGWDRNTWPGIAQLINARVASWWHVRGGGTLVGTPGLAEMPDLDTGTTKVTAAPTIGCCTGTTWAGVAGPRAILTGLKWLDTWLPAVCPGVPSLVRWASLTGLTTAICRTLHSTVFISTGVTMTLVALDNTAVSLLLCPPATSPSLSLGYSCHNGVRQASALLTSRPNLADVFIKFPRRGLQTSSCTRTHREAESVSSDRLCVQRMCRLHLWWLLPVLMYHLSPWTHRTEVCLT